MLLPLILTTAALAQEPSAEDPATAELSTSEPAAAEPATPAAEQAPAPSTLSEAELASALRRYRRDHLARGGYHATSSSAVYTPGTSVGGVYMPGTVMPINSTVDTWTVYDGTGTMLTPARFASRLGDRAMARRLEDERKHANTGGILLGTLGTVALIKSLSVAASDEFSEAEILTWSMLAGTGLGVGIAWPLGVSHKQHYVSRYWSTREADEAIDDYNEALRKKLKLREEDLPTE